MKVLHAFVGLLLMVALLLGAGSVVWAARTAGSWEAFTRGVAGGRVTWSCAALGLACVMAIFGLSGIPRGSKERYLSFDSEGGTVSISSVAICDYIAKLAQEFPSVMRLSPSVIPKRDKIDILVRLHVKAGPSIHEVCELLQQRVRESVSNGLGISQIGRVEVSVKEIVSEHRRV